MNLLSWNSLPAVLGAPATGPFAPESLAVGLLLGYPILCFARRRAAPAAYVVRALRVIAFAFFYLKEMVKANLRVAHDVLTRTHHMRPGVIAIPLDAKTDVEITVLAHLLTLTPGTLSLDVSPDRKTLYVHVMYIDRDVEAMRQEIKEGLEKRVLRVLR